MNGLSLQAYIAILGTDTVRKSFSSNEHGRQSIRSGIYCTRYYYVVSEFIKNCDKIVPVVELQGNRSVRSTM